VAVFVDSNVSEPEPDPDRHGSALIWPSWIRSGSGATKLTKKQLLVVPVISF